MQFHEVLSKCKGQNIVINSGEERLLISVEDDFLVLEGGNPQMKITEFVPFSHITRVVRADYTATGDSSMSLDLTYSAGDQRRAGGH
ncbi:MAG: hypothetical protein ACO1SX_15610 [Actinomycetota bacterium]